MAHDSHTTDALTIRGPRRSACLTKSREREQARLRRLSVEERIVAALTMGARFAWLKPAPGKTN